MSTETTASTTKTAETKPTKRFVVSTATDSTDYSKMSDAIKKVDQLKQKKVDNIKLLDTKSDTKISYTRRPNTSSYIVTSAD